MRRAAKNTLLWLNHQMAAAVQDLPAMQPAPTVDGVAYIELRVRDDELLGARSLLLKALRETIHAVLQDLRASLVPVPRGRAFVQWTGFNRHPQQAEWRGCIIFRHPEEKTNVA